MQANIRDGISEAADFKEPQRRFRANSGSTKPYTAREMIARVRAHLKRSLLWSENVKRHLTAAAGIEPKYLRAYVTQGPLPAAILRGPSHHFVFANNAYLRLLGLEHYGLWKRPVRDLFPVVGSPGPDEILNRTYQRGERFVAREQPLTLYQSGKKQLRYLDLNCSPIRNGKGDIDAIFLQAVDVTEKVGLRIKLEKRLEQGTAELQKAGDRIRELDNQLKYVQEQEQRRLARELHDGAGQLIAAIKWKLSILHQKDTSHDPEISQIVSGSLALSDELSQEIRTVSHLLHAPLLDEAGFSYALRRYIDGLAERSGIAVDLQIDSNLEQMPVEVEATVFRVIQEALTNIHRHARTKSAAVRLRQSLNDITLEIEDRGRGIPDFMSLSQPNFKAGIGIQSMRERIRQLNGRFDLASGRAGTTITAVLPKAAYTADLPKAA